MTRAEVCWQIQSSEEADGWEVSSALNPQDSRTFLLEFGGLQCSEVHAERSPCAFRAPRAGGRAAVTFGVHGEMFVSSGGTAEPLLTLFAVWGKGEQGAGVTGVIPIRITWP